MLDSFKSEYHASASSCILGTFKPSIPYWIYGAVCSVIDTRLTKTHQRYNINFKTNKVSIYIVWNYTERSGSGLASINFSNLKESNKCAISLINLFTIYFMRVNALLYTMHSMLPVLVDKKRRRLGGPLLWVADSKPNRGIQVSTKSKII